MFWFQYILPSNTIIMILVSFLFDVILPHHWNLYQPSQANVHELYIQNSNYCPQVEVQEKKKAEEAETSSPAIDGQLHSHKTSQTTAAAAAAAATWLTDAWKSETLSVQAEDKRVEKHNVKILVCVLQEWPTSPIMQCTTELPLFISLS